MWSKLTRVLLPFVFLKPNFSVHPVDSQMETPMNWDIHRFYQNIFNVFVVFMFYIKNFNILYFQMKTQQHEKIFFFNVVAAAISNTNYSGILCSNCDFPNVCGVKWAFSDGANVVTKNHSGLSKQTVLIAETVLRGYWFKGHLNQLKSRRQRESGRLVKERRQ